MSAETERARLSAAFGHFVSASCVGTRCDRCGAPTQATHKVEEVVFDDAPPAEQQRHPLTAYLCCDHFRALMGPAAGCRAGVP